VAPAQLSEEAARTLVGNAASALNSLTLALQSQYNATLQTWSARSQLTLQPLTPNSVNQATETQRSQILVQWTQLIQAIQEIVKARIQDTKRLQDWKAANMPSAPN
jgi:hypothetical protein